MKCVCCIACSQLDLVTTEKMTHFHVNQIKRGKKQHRVILSNCHNNRQSITSPNNYFTFYRSSTADRKKIITKRIAMTERKIKNSFGVPQCRSRDVGKRSPRSPRFMSVIEHRKCVCLPENVYMRTSDVFVILPSANSIVHLKHLRDFSTK